MTTLGFRSVVIGDRCVVSLARLFSCFVSPGTVVAGADPRIGDGDGKGR